MAMNCSDQMEDVARRLKGGSVLGRAKYFEGPTLEDHIIRLQQQYGTFPEPSSEPGDVDRPRRVLKERSSLMAALRSAIMWQLNFPRDNELATSILRNYLNGTTGIRSSTASYQVLLGHDDDGKKIWANFAWGNDQRTNQGDQAVFYESQQEAFAAAIQRSREVHSVGAITVANLRQRFDAVDTSSGGYIPVDRCIPGLVLVWRTNGSRLSIRAEITRDRLKHCRDYFFPTTWTSGPGSDDTENEGMDTDDDLNEVEAHLAEVTMGSPFDTVVVSAQSLAAMPDSEKSRHRFLKSSGFQLPGRPVPIDPYFVGLWLGDGSRRGAIIATGHESETRGFLANFAAELDLHLIYYGGVQYGLVANAGPGRAADLPPTIASGPTAWRPTRRISRQTLYKQRIAAGWRTQVNRKPGEKRFWLPPADSYAADDSMVNVPIVASDKFGIPSGGLADDYEEADVTRSAMSAVTSAITQKRDPPSSPPLPAQPPMQRRKSGRHVIPDSSDADDDSPSLATGSTLLAQPRAQHRKCGHPIIPDSSDDTVPARAALSLDPHPSDASSPHQGTISELLMSDRNTRSLVGPAEVLADADKEHELDILDMFEQPADNMETIDSLDIDDVVFITEPSNEEDTAITLQSGARTYGDLEPAEEDALVDGILGNAEQDNLSSVDPPKAPRKINTLLQALHRLNLTVAKGVTGAAADRKHIPAVYMDNSREVRLALLAGMIDSDGHYAYWVHAITISQAEEWHSRHFWDTVTLAQSLGFTVCTWRRDRTKASPQLEMKICGDIDEIPCLLIRKQPLKRSHAVRSGFGVQKIVRETMDRDYTHFVLDGDQCYLRDDYIILHSGEEHYDPPILQSSSTEIADSEDSSQEIANSLASNSLSTNIWSGVRVSLTSSGHSRFILFGKPITVNYGTDIPNLEQTVKGQKRYLYGPGSILVAHSNHEATTEKELFDAVDGYKTLILHALIENAAEEQPRDA
ncbi:hypothetical protein B0A48_05800 [Cryoendolithus antarcticus]|uniref:Uncharacterized protein n=1 Tax=Cryoendolithus antarcticus TaxID=1507870 RepID=A0A1V8TC11_9PEZI|nr:hypothetical protein B0A48_05800 [Cryoendolithus antarcticus]